MGHATEQPDPFVGTRNKGEEIDVRFLLGHLTIAVLRHCVACQEAEGAARLLPREASGTGSSC
jgi:hypothetical protein